MTQKDIQLVRRSWRIFQQMDPVLIGETFYTKLFADTPALRRMFPRSLEAQAQKLIDMLSVIVARLDRREELTPQLRAMGQRHLGYGVRDEHYEHVGKALLWTLQQGFGKDWNTDLEAAWASCYLEIVEAMISAPTPEYAGQQPR